LLPLLALVQLRPDSSALCGLSRSAFPWLFPCSRHANEDGQKWRKTMTTIDFILLINALAQLLTACAKIFSAFRHRK
jgi:hypothetical protein